MIYTWIGAALGNIVGGPLGLLAGLALGYVIDKAAENDTPEANHSSSTTSHFDHQPSDPQQVFRFSLLVLISYVVRADGKIMHSEMELVRRWLEQNFGSVARQEGEQVLDRLFLQQRSMGMAAYRSLVVRSCHQLASMLPYEHRLALLDFLMRIAKADGVVCTEELEAIRECGFAMSISTEDVESILHLTEGGNSLDAAYKVLGVSAQATDAEVKAAYRAMALKCHPDKVAALGEEVRRAAEKKLQEVNAAKEVIWKARGL